jgi:hypothetical protein
VGARFAGLGTALVGDVANAEVGLFGSVFGFDDKFEKSIHDDINAQTHTASGHAQTGAKAGAAHPGAAHAGHSAGAAHETVDHIVGDPYALDELATRLYPNIRSRLRQELLIDRERAGLLADFR